MQDLGAKLTLYPTGATCPNNIDWNIDPKTYELNNVGGGNYQFTPKETGRYEVVATCGNLMGFRSEYITVTRVSNYVSSLSINPGYETISVTKGDAETLNDLLAKALKVSYYIQL